MPNGYYDHLTYPGTNAPGSSSAMRAELELIEEAFNKLPNPATHATRLIFCNAGGTALSGSTNLTWTDSANTLTVNGTIIGTGLTLTSPILTTPVVNTPTINQGAIQGAAITGGTITNAAITGGTIVSLTSPVPVASGGTGATSAGAALTALGALAAAGGTLTSGTLTTCTVDTPTMNDGSWDTGTVTNGLTVSSGNLTVTAGNITMAGVILTAKVLRATKSAWAPTSMAHGETRTTTVTVTGAVMGDFVEVSSMTSLAGGWVLRGDITSTDTATLTILNGTGISGAPPSADYKVKVTS